MPPRTDLQSLLETLLGSEFVYFQPPPSVRMTYPCIVYDRSFINVNSADNISYKHEKRYTVTVIDKDPDSVIPDKIARLPRVSFERHFTAENLNHDVFTIIF